jgi:hypothetical protein
MLVACNDPAELPAAPLDSKSGLESLATAYEVETSKLSVSPTMLRPKIRKQFVIDVFKTANFSYAKTLQIFRQINATAISKNTKDLAELLSLPHKNISSQSKVELYSQQEFEAINLIDKIVN